MTTPIARSRRWPVILDTTLTGHGTLELLPRSTRFDVALAADRIDVDRLMGTSPSPEAARKPGGAAPPPAAAAVRAAPSPYTGLSGRLTLQVAAAQARRQKVTDLRARVMVKEDELTLEEARLGAWEGRLDLAGTSLHLAPADRPFSLRARTEGVQVGPMLATWSDKQVLTGRLDAEVRLSGKGETGEAIRRSLDGTVEGKLADGVFHGLDLVAGVTEPLVKAVPSLQGKVARAGRTSLAKVVPVSLRIQGGKALLQKPVEFEERGATGSVRGAVGLDGELELPVTMSLPPAMVADLTGGKARPQAPLPFTFRLDGKAWSPRVAGLDVGPAARTLLESAGLQSARKKLEDEGKKALKKFLGK